MSDRPPLHRPPSPLVPSRRPSRWLPHAAVALAAVLSLLVAGSAQAAPPSDTSGRANGTELTARWWPVALSSQDFSFFEDSTTGGNCRQVDLPSGTLVMVAGTLGGASGERACTIPSGATVLLPVLNAAFFLTDPRPLDTVGEARAVSRDFLAGAQVEATVDGEPVRVIRKKGPVVSTDLSVLGVEGPVRTTIDGYWLVWEAEPGTHTVTTYGIVRAGQDDEFMTSTRYTFSVT